MDIPSHEKVKMYAARSPPVAPPNQEQKEDPAQSCTGMMMYVYKDMYSTILFLG